MSVGIPRAWIMSNLPVYYEYGLKNILMTDLDHEEQCSEKSLLTNVASDDKVNVAYS